MGKFLSAFEHKTKGRVTNFFVRLKKNRFNCSNQRIMKLIMLYKNPVEYKEEEEAETDGAWMGTRPVGSAVHEVHQREHVHKEPYQRRHQHYFESLCASPAE